MARAAQQAGENGKARDAGNGMEWVTEPGIGERDVAGLRTRGRMEARILSNSPVGLGNQSPWSGEPWANHGEPDQRKSKKCLKLRDGHEVSAGVRVDPEVPGSMAGVPVGSRVSGTWGNVERVAPWPPAADGRHTSAFGSRVGTPTREGSGVVECG